MRKDLVGISIVLAGGFGGFWLGAHIGSPIYGFVVDGCFYLNCIFGYYLGGLTGVVIYIGFNLDLGKDYQQI
ncbi:MAG: hypothetical protein GY805_37000 [Chloroflexi bacterium]|nr:hypothetical protein [Chloroflexota bacterium]